MNEQELVKIDPEDFRIYLREELIIRCKKNPSYSLRGFARDLEIDNSVLSKILSGKRKLGNKLITRLLGNLEMGIAQFEQLVKKENSPEDLIKYEKLAIDLFSIISDWYHYAILELLRVDNYKSDVKWIASVLGIDKFECEDAIERLIRVDMIEKMEDGTLIDVSGGKSTNISRDMKSSALRKLQKQLLEKSIENIDQVKLKQRNNTSLTMAIDTEKLPEAIEEITKFRRKMGKLLSRGTKRNEVYNLSISLSPLSHISRE